MRKGILRAPQRALESTIAPRSRRGKRHVGFWLSAKRITRPYLRISLSRNADFCRWRTFVSAESSLETNRFFFGRYIDGFRENQGLGNGAETKLNILESNGRRVRPDRHAIFQKLFLSNLWIGMQLVCTCYFESRHVRYASYCFALGIMAPLVRHLI